MKNRLLGFLFLLFLASSVNASALQDTLKTRILSYSAGLTPSALLNIAPGFQINQKLTINNLLVLGLESGLISSYIYDDAKDIRGMRFRPSINFVTTISKGAFFSLGVFYNYRKISYRVEREETKGQGNYIEIVKTDVTNTFKGGGLIAGFKILSDQIDYSVGLGLGNGSLKSSSSNPDFNSLFDFTNFWLPGIDRDAKLPIVILNFSINYRFL